MKKNEELLLHLREMDRFFKSKKYSNIDIILLNQSILLSTIHNSNLNKNAKGIISDIINTSSKIYIKIMGKKVLNELSNIGYSKKDYPSKNLKNRWEILKKYNFKCIYCGASSEDAFLTLEHIKSKHNKGKDNIKNIAPCCQECNLGKNKESINLIKYQHLIRY